MNACDIAEFAQQVRSLSHAMEMFQRSVENFDASVYSFAEAVEKHAAGTYVQNVAQVFSSTVENTTAVTDAPNNEITGHEDCPGCMVCAERLRT